MDHPNGVLARDVQEVVDHAHDVDLRHRGRRCERHGLGAPALEPDRRGQGSDEEGRHAQEQP